MCEWNAVPDNTNEVLKPVKFIVDYFKMGLAIKKGDLPYKISKDDNNGTITIVYGSTTVVKIQRKGSFNLFGIEDVKLYMYTSPESRLPTKTIEKGIRLKRNEETLEPVL